MTRITRTRRALAASAMVLLSLSSSSSFIRSGPFAAATAAAGTSREWKAPARAAATSNPVRADDKSLAAGKTLYAKECASCHGDTGKGNGPDAADLSRQPPDFASPAVARQSDGELFWKMSEGRKPMPRFARKFPEADRWNLVNYIRSIAR
jgi:mono/diheme cytochrome c family protein